MTVTKKEARDALRSLCSDGQRVNASAMLKLQAMIDAMPPDPESREERLGRVCFEAYFTQPTSFNWDGASAGTRSNWIAAAVAVAEQCKPKAITAEWLHGEIMWRSTVDAAVMINRYVRGDD